METFIEVIGVNAEKFADKIALKNCNSDLLETSSINYFEFNTVTDTYARNLSIIFHPGRRILLYFNDPIDYICVLIGCQKAGLVPTSGMPAFALHARSPRRLGRLDRLNSILATADAAGIVGPEHLIAPLRILLPKARIAGLELVDFKTLSLEPAHGTPSFLNAVDEVAFVQFTSGTTGEPRGIQVTHANLMSNLLAQVERFSLTSADVSVNWAPLFHDMGLIGGTLLPLLVGAKCVSLPASTVIERPHRWIEAISHFRGTISWAPDFAYRLAAEAVSSELWPQYDLRCWRIAVNASEPVHAATLEKFSRNAAPAGFDPSAFCPLYGLAEATLVATTSNPSVGATTITVDRDALTQGRIVLEPSAPADDQFQGSSKSSITLVSCGSPVSGMEVQIVDPASRTACPMGQVGEIWLSGPSIARSVLGPEGRNLPVADGVLQGVEGAYLRTGDLGALWGEDLFVVGRLKDLIIVRGVNIQPAEIEFIVASSHPAIRSEGVCVFGERLDFDEVPVILFEIRRGQDASAPEAARSALAAVSSLTGLEIGRICALPFGSVLKTPSGKIQRSACRAGLNAGQLIPIFDLKLPSMAEQSSEKPGQWSDLYPQSGVVGWLNYVLEQRLGRNIPQGASLAELGVNSISLTEFAGDILSKYGIRPNVAEMFELQYFDKIVDYIISEIERKM